MTESLEENLKKCFAAWRNNPTLGAPYLFSSIISIFLAILYVAAVIFLFNPLQGQGTALAAFGQPAINWSMLALDILLLIPLIFAFALNAAYFQAGAIGMSWKALETGKTSLDDLAYYGGKKFLSVFLANMVIYVPMIVIAIILALLQYVFPGDFVSILAALVGILLAMVPYAIVIGDMDAFKSIGHSYGFFKENKLQTTLLYAFTYYFSLFATYWLILACIIIFSFSLFFIPVPGEYTSIEVFFAGLISAIPVIASAGLLALIVFILAASYVLCPLATLFWAELYLSGAKYKNKTN